VRGTLSASVSGGTLDTVSTAARTQSWTLDALGNWTSSATNGTSTSRTHDSKNEVTVVGGNTLTFDDDGNTLTDEAGQQYTFDAWNHLKQAKDASSTVIATYSYDAAGRRITQAPASGATTDLYYGGNNVLEQRQSTTVTSQNVWGAGVRQRPGAA